MGKGVYALPAAGLLTGVPWLLVLGYPSAKTDPGGYARSLASAANGVGEYLYLAGLILLLLGLLALYGHLARGRSRSWAFGAMIASVVGISLALPLFGITRMADPILADVYLAGQPDLSPALGLLTDQTLTYRTTGYFVVVMVVSLAGAIGYAVSVWRSGNLPRWAGIVVAAGFALNMLSPGVAWVGAVCLVVGGLALARSVSHPSSAH